MAQLHNNCVAQIYGGELIDNKIFYCSMEFVNGFTLREYLPHVSSLGRRWIIAYLYIDAISETTTPELAHGDAHDRNVMITCRTIKQNEPELFSFSQGVYYTREPQLKLVDFGTSRVLGRSGWRQRHWRTVKETVKKILKPFESLKDEIGSISAYSDDNKPSFYKTLLHILRREAEADLTFTSAEDFGEELFVLLSAKQRTSP